MDAHCVVSLLGVGLGMGLGGLSLLLQYLRGRTYMRLFKQLAEAVGSYVSDYEGLNVKGRGLKEDVEHLKRWRWAQEERWVLLLRHFGLQFATIRAQEEQTVLQPAGKKQEKRA